MFNQAEFYVFLKNFVPFHWKEPLGKVITIPYFSDAELKLIEEKYRSGMLWEYLKDYPYPLILGVENFFGGKNDGK